MDIKCEHLQISNSTGYEHHLTHKAQEMSNKLQELDK
jgi:hypothetical protein